MTTEERYPNFARLTALLNQQEHPRRMLNALVSLSAVEGVSLYNLLKKDGVRKA